MDISTALQGAFDFCIDNMDDGGVPLADAIWHFGLSDEEADNLAAMLRDYAREQLELLEARLADLTA